ncbi:MAG: DUF4982 domain-containing protein [Phycisphaerales bacterium]|jgi:beta-galactosidase|nr:DUF4982 domain-containing protein [Phycisphaerales bacterium]MBT7170950.1 DUF4982 domain-containing protein [Phycisphaerales bacterium]
MTRRMILLTALASLCICPLAQAQTKVAKCPLASVQTLNEGWTFTLGDPADAKGVKFDDSKWEKVSVPHDWMIRQPYSPDHPSAARNGCLPTGKTCWYRTTIDYTDRSVPAGPQTLVFDGLMSRADVYINGVHLGHWPYGYAPIAFDISKHINLTGKNTLAVRIDMSKKFPAARWYSGMGIIRNVKLISAPANGLARPWPVTARVDNNSTAKEAKIDVVARLTPASGIKREVKHTLCDHKGNLVATANEKGVIVVKSPKLWSPESPYLYTLTTSVLSTSKGALIDQHTTRIGIRTLAWSGKEGFLLNGKPCKIKGMCEHDDAAIEGAAKSVETMRFRISLLKTMGCNAIRTAHNPRAAEFYDLCDEMGMLVMNEFFDGWYQPKAAGDFGHEFAKYWKQVITNVVRRDANHPCVFLWSVGNEIRGFKATKGIEVVAFLRALDPSRKSTAGLSGGALFDVAGFNGHGGMPGKLEHYHKAHPDQPVILTEVPHTLQTRGFYRAATWWRDRGRAKHEIKPLSKKQIFFDGHKYFHSSYDNAGVRINAQTCWNRTKNSPWIAGEFRWTGFDYIGENYFGGRGWPARLGNFGIIDLCGFPKDHYYYYQSQWATAPMVHLLPHWTWPELKLGTVIPVVAYSNCDETELFLNGKSLGRKKTGEPFAPKWDVPYTPGTLEAVGYKGGKEAARTKRVTAGPATTLEVKLDPEHPNRLVFKALDAKGNFAPRCNNTVFVSDSSKVILGMDNGSPIDVTQHTKPYRRLFHGLALAKIKLADQFDIGYGAIFVSPWFETSTTATIQRNFATHGMRVKRMAMPIHYTLDGSEPTLKSPEYSGAITIDRTTTIKATVFAAGKPYLKMHETTTKGKAEPVTDSRLRSDDSAGKSDGEKPTGGKVKKPKGPFDKQLVGSYKDGGNTFTFTADGKVLKGKKGKTKQIGWWWYDWPDDEFEDPKDAGTGELIWINSGERSKLNFKSKKCKVLQVKTGKATRQWQRQEAEESKTPKKSKKKTQ